jgi:hypothetical protein
MEKSLLEYIELVDKDLADFCKDLLILEDEEVEEVWRMFRKEASTN